jgi:hypothetical protein
MQAKLQTLSPEGDAGFETGANFGFLMRFDSLGSEIVNLKQALA